jgi:hypothetical protein
VHAAALVRLLGLPRAPQGLGCVSFVPGTQCAVWWAAHLNSFELIPAQLYCLMLPDHQSSPRAWCSWAVSSFVILPWLLRVCRGHRNVLIWLSSRQVLAHCLLRKHAAAQLTP